MGLKDVTARAFLYEKDHQEGVFFIDYLRPSRRELIQKDLDRITGSRT
ncbi:MAG TPA: hypothetical protein O0X23_01235 [Methanocorpusculum sp.]|nr:hypothetical protein [Methanocorpusculum sp.]